jgi:hypothetical protein
MTGKNINRFVCIVGAVPKAIRHHRGACCSGACPADREGGVCVQLIAACHIERDKRNFGLLFSGINHFVKCFAL